MFGAFAKTWGRLISLILLCACGAVRTAKEPLQLESWQDVDEARLGLVKGRTSLEEAERAMRRLGLTGAVSDVYVGEHSPRMVSALGADFQSRLFLFEENRFVQSVAVRSGEVLPFRYVLRFATAQGRLVLLALYRDPLEETAQAGTARRPRLGMFVEGAQGFEHLTTAPLEQLTVANGGLTRPLFVGRDLGEGLMFLARDRDGQIWPSAYLMSLHGGELSLATLTMKEAARCSCVEAWLRGEDEPAQN